MMGVTIDGDRGHTETVSAMLPGLQNDFGISDRKLGFGDFDFGLESQRYVDGTGDEAEPFRFVQQVESTSPLLGAGNLEGWVDHNFAETITGLSLAHCAAGLNLKVGEVKMSTARDAS